MFVLFEARGSRPGFGIRFEWSHRLRVSSSLNSGRIAASQPPADSTNSFGRKLNSLVDHYTGGHGMLFCLKIRSLFWWHQRRGCGELMAAAVEQVGHRRRSVCHVISVGTPSLTAMDPTNERRSRKKRNAPSGYRISSMPAVGEQYEVRRRNRTRVCLAN